MQRLPQRRISNTSLSRTRSGYAHSFVTTHLRWQVVPLSLARVTVSERLRSDTNARRFRACSGTEVNMATFQQKTNICRDTQYDYVVCPFISPSHNDELFVPPFFFSFFSILNRKIQQLLRALLTQRCYLLDFWICEKKSCDEERRVPWRNKSVFVSICGEGGREGTEQLTDRCGRL